MYTRTHTHTFIVSFCIHTTHTCIQASSQAIRREQSIPQIGQGSTHVAHHGMLKQQSFKRGGRGRSQIVETSLRQGSKIDRREGGGGERRARLGKGVRGKRRVFSKQCRCLHNESLAWYLPNTSRYMEPSSVCFLKRTILIIIITCGSPALALNTPFSLAPPFPPRPLPSLLMFSLPVSLSLSFACPRRSRVVCGGTVKPVCLSSLEALQT